MTNVEKLRSSGAAFRLNGLMACLDAKKATPEEITEIRKMKNDVIVLGGRKMSTYANAVLDLLGIEKYNGNDEDTKELIKGLKL